jgi:hypothetical protein
MALTAAMQPVASDLYAKAGQVSSAERMLHVVQANGASLETIARHEEALASAIQAYKDSVLAMAQAAGATVGAVVVSVGLCAPALILPTP